MGVRCEIILDNRIIYAGGTLSGRIVYHFDSKETFQAIKLFIRGKAHFSYQDDKDTVHVKEDFLSDEVVMYGGKEQQTCIMKKGTYTYPFKYILALESPSSYTFYDCQTPSEIKYTIRTKRITALWSHNDAIEEFFVVKHVDLNFIPEANEHSNFNMSKDTFWLCCASRPFFVCAHLERKGFTPGSKIPLSIECDNQSSYPAEELIVCLRLTINYYRQKSNCKPNERRLLHGRQPSSITLSEISFGSIAAYETKTWQSDMKIPRIQPLQTEGCRILGIEYILHFKVRFQFPHRDLTGGMPITLGNIPIGSEFDSCQTKKLALISDLKELKNYKIMKKFNYV